MEEDTQHLTTHDPFSSPEVGQDVLSPKEEESVSSEASKRLSVQSIPAASGRRWLQHFPWIGVTAIATTLLSVLASAAVLYFSDGVRVDHWEQRIKTSLAPPSVILSVINSGANWMLATAVSEGIAIAWWHKAMKGSTVANLHGYWEQSESSLNVVKSIFSFNTIALAALMTKLTALDGAFLQEATTVVVGTDFAMGEAVSLTARISEEFPVAFTGVQQALGGTAEWYTANMGCLIGDSTKEGEKIDPYDDCNVRPLDKEDASWDFISGCNGLCFGKVKAVGFAMECSSTTRAIDYGSADSKEQENVLFDASFKANWNTSGTGFGTITANFSFVDTTATTDGSCPGTLNVTTCILRPAVLDYAITVNNNSAEADDTATFVDYVQLLPSFNIDDPHASQANFTAVDKFSGILGTNYTTTISHYLNVTESPKTSLITTLDGIRLALSSTLGSHSTISFNSTLQRYLVTTSGQPTPYLPASTRNATSPPNAFCAYALPFTGFAPAATMKNWLDTLTFRFALQAAFADNPTPARNQTLTQGLQFGIHSYYKTNYWYLLASFLTMVVAIIGMAPAYWGYWRLGRRVSLAPFEVAGYMGVEVLEDGDEVDDDVEGMMGKVGGRGVRYGVKGDGRFGLVWVREVDGKDRGREKGKGRERVGTGLRGFRGFSVRRKGVRRPTFGRGYEEIRMEARSRAGQEV